MDRFHVILADELGEEFSVEVEARSAREAWDMVAADYPESSVVSVRSLRRIAQGYLR